MEAELKRIAVRALDMRLTPRRVDPSTIQVDFDAALARTVVDYLRTPSRIVWDLACFSANRLEPLFDEMMAWLADAEAPWLATGLALSVEVGDVDAFGAGPLQVRGTVKNALIEGSAAR